MHLKLHQCLEAIAVLCIENLCSSDLILLQLADWQIDSAAPRVFADVANDVRQLKGEPEFFCVDQRTFIGVAKDAG